VWRAGVLACSELFTRPDSAGKMPASPTARMAVLRHLRHALTIQIDFADTFYPREDVIHSLAPDSH